MTGAEYKSMNGASATFDGFSLLNSDVLLKYTYYGDTDFGGSVNFNDYVRTDNGFNNHLTGWMNGDFDYNGAVNFDDYVLIDLSNTTQSGVRSGGDYDWQQLTQFWHFRLDGYMDYFINSMEKYGYQLTVYDFYPDGNPPPPIEVPEPGVFGLAAASAAALLTRRRQRRDDGSHTSSLHLRPTGTGVH